MTNIHALQSVCNVAGALQLIYNDNNDDNNQ